MLRFSRKNALPFMDEAEVKMLEGQVRLAHEMIEKKNGPGHEFLGWADLPKNYDKEGFDRILKRPKEYVNLRTSLSASASAGHTSERRPPSTP